MAVKILFVYPEFPDTFWSFKHALKFIRKPASSPPLGLLTVASMLPTGWEKRLVDLNAELDSLYALGWRKNVFFVDDNFIGNKKQLKEKVLPALIGWRQGKVGMPFSTEVSINLAECSKFQNKNRDLVNSVKLIQHAGLQVQGGFIVGFDSDTPAIFQQQMDFIQKSGIVAAMVGLLQAPYGTQLYERMKREGRLTDEMSGDNVDGRTNIIWSRSMSWPFFARPINWASREWNAPSTGSWCSGR